MYSLAVRTRVIALTGAAVLLAALGAPAVSAHPTSTAERTIASHIVAVDSTGSDVEAARVARKCKKVKIRTHHGKRITVRAVCKPVKKPAKKPVVVTPPATPPATPPTTGSTSYAFMSTSPDGSPRRWDKCTPIRYAVNLASLPEGALGEINEGIARLSAASGLTFTYVGDTTAIPLTDTWSDTAMGGPIDLYLAYSDETVLPGLAGDVAGLGGPVWYEGAEEQPRLRLAGAVFDLNSGLAPGFGPGGRGLLVLHELGHTLNLGHVDDARQVMYPMTGVDSPTDYQAGDRAGMAVLATPPCFS